MTLAAGTKLGRYEIRSQLGGGPVETFQVGQSFFEPPGATHLVSANASNIEPAELIAVFVADEGAQLIRELGLKSTIQRVHVGDTGCASAMVAMQQVSNHLRAFPDHRAVMVAVEICSAAYFLDDRLESAVAHAIFADGAGAIALSTDAAGPELVEHRTMFRSEHLGAMGFEYPGGRPRVVLSKDVRRIGAGMMTEMAQALMSGQGLKKEDVAHFVLHSAGRRVIEQVGKLMELDEPQLAHSRHVLQHYGNMSSATVIFVLDDLFRSRETVPGDWGLMIALGPGFAAEGALLRW